MDEQLHTRCRTQADGVFRRKELNDFAIDRSDDIPIRRVDGDTIAHHVLRKHRIRHVFKRHNRPVKRCGDHLFLRLLLAKPFFEQRTSSFLLQFI
ncbi:hypothetical protein B4109_2905 [Geobacillus stearothermophilus]|uniref:Uncharacterized protein n=1 Tax=Geobacillus stearothermophilus TaxID=1422 RepID=A0A150MPW5_GEOSE|nr:hypothetical protein B4109_2905 [Geobacillus stearothermophilus]